MLTYVPEVRVRTAHPSPQLVLLIHEDQFPSTGFTTHHVFPFLLPFQSVRPEGNEALCVSKAQSQVFSLDQREESPQRSVGSGQWLVSPQLTTVLVTNVTDKRIGLFLGRGTTQHHLCFDPLAEVVYHFLRTSSEQLTVIAGHSDGTTIDLVDRGIAALFTQVVTFTVSHPHTVFLYHRDRETKRTGLTGYRYDFHDVHVGLVHSVHHALYTEVFDDRTLSLLGEHHRRDIALHDLLDVLLIELYQRGLQHRLIGHSRVVGESTFLRIDRQHLWGYFYELLQSLSVGHLDLGFIVLSQTQITTMFRYGDSALFQQLIRFGTHTGRGVGSVRDDRTYRLNFLVQFGFGNSLIENVVVKQVVVGHFLFVLTEQFFNALRGVFLAGLFVQLSSFLYRSGFRETHPS